MKTFESHGYKYAVDDFGVINQLDPKPFVYDDKYVSTYDTEEYRKGNELLQAMRLAFVIGAHGSVPQSIQDNGYGNGAFMLYARKMVPNVYGLDVTGVKVEGCEIVSGNTLADVYTFWDCLEHIEDLSFLRKIKCNTICISLPWCHLSTKGKEWFDNCYKHRKPNEHLRHFTPRSLNFMMECYGWTSIATSHHEDIVRVSAHGLPNILSMAFKRSPNIEHEWI